MSSQKKQYLRSRPSSSRTFFRSIVSSSCPIRDETWFFRGSRSAARLLLLLAAASGDTCLLLSDYCCKLMADYHSCFEILGESPGTQHSNDEKYMLRRLECNLLKIRDSCGLFTREEEADYRSYIDTRVASIQETLAHNSRQICEIIERLTKYNIEIEKLREKYDQEIQGIKEANGLNREFFMAKIDAAKREGEPYAFMLNKMRKKEKKRKKEKRR